MAGRAKASSRWIIIVALAALLLLPAFSMPARALYTTTPIVVEGDGDFTGAGFTGGGTPADPYVLEGVNVYAYQKFHGIVVANTTKHFRIVGCTVTDAYTPDRDWLNLSASGSGILLANVTNGEVIDFLGEYNARGVTLANCRNVTISSSMLSNNVECGVYINGCLDGGYGIANCTFLGNRNGVLVEDSEGAAVRDNVIDDGVIGVRLVANAGCCTDNLVLGNEIGGQTGDGISLGGTMGTNGNLVQDNRLHDIAGAGIHIERGTGENMTGNDIAGCLYGVRLSSDGNTLFRNTLSNNTYGIRCESGADTNTMADNSIADGGTGILIAPSIGNLVHNNTILRMNEGSSPVGIYLDGAVRDALLSDNTVTDCDLGIRASTNQEISGLSVTGNTVNCSLRQGIYLVYVSDSQVSGNVLRENGLEGLYMASGTNNTIHGNAFLFNKDSGRQYSSLRPQAYCGEEGNDWYLDTGNLWTDWLYPDENEDGIVDVPYPIPDGCQDPFPLTSIPGLTIPDDLTPPQVVEWLPQGSSVDHDSIISIFFSEDMDEGSVIVTVNDVPQTGEWDDRTLHLNTTLDFETDYLVRVTGQDLVGNNMTEFQWSFRTEDPNATVSGRVLTESSIVLAEVEVTCGDRTVYTDIGGSFSLLLPPGEHALSLSKDGYLDRNLTVQVLPGQDLDLGDLVMEADEEGPTYILIAIIIAIVAAASAGLLVRWWRRR